ncbi:hypothetical protein MTO96_034068 [Rhipicephalus appendiculatus]
MARHTDWDAFRERRLHSATSNIEDLSTWTDQQLAYLEAVTASIPTTEDHPAIDSLLAHLWAASTLLTVGISNATTVAYAAASHISIVRSSNTPPCLPAHSGNSVARGSSGSWAASNPGISSATSSNPVFQQCPTVLTMATYATRRESLVTCPFNPAHQVKSGRYQIHITKCKKSHPGIDIYRCPFSPDHVVEPSKLMHHVYTCPLNTTVKRYLSKPDKDVVEPRVATIKAAPDIKPEEDWEEEANKPETPKGKTPRSAVHPIFTDVQAMAPAQRKKFYASLREKANVSTSGDAEPSSPETAAKDPETATSDGTGCVQHP